MNLMHTLTAGGTIAGRYMENQIPFFGYSISFHMLEQFAAMFRTDLRWAISHVNYVSLQGAILQDSETFKGMWHKPLTAYTIGAEFGRKTVAGPLQLGLHWCNDTGFGATLSFGLVF